MITLGQQQEIEQKKTALRKFKKNILLMGKICFPSAFTSPSPAFHAQILRDLADPDVNRLLITAPRGFSKSTIASFLYVMWRIAFKSSDEDLFIVIISEARQQSINFLTRIKYHLDTSVIFKMLFGNMTEATSERWTLDDIILGNGTRVCALGTGQKIRSFISKDTRPNVIIADDFESLKNTLTKEARAQNRVWLTSSVIPALAPNGKMIVIGNVIHNDCFLMWARESKSWKVHWYSALGTDGQSLWPERFSLKYLEEKKEEMSSVGNINGFYTEYMNQPMSPENAPFKPEFMQRHHYLIERTDDGQPYLTNYLKSEVHDYAKINIPIYIYQGIDPASSLSERADYFVITTLGVDAEENVYILDIFRQRLAPSKQAGKIIELYLRFMPRRVTIETVAYQEALRDGVRALAKESSIYIPGIERGLKPRNSKSERLLSLVPIFARGKFFFRPQDIEAEKEFLTYPKSRYDDQMDSIWMAMQKARPCRIKEIDITGTVKKIKHRIIDWHTV